MGLEGDDVALLEPGEELLPGEVIFHAGELGFIFGLLLEAADQFVRDGGWGGV